MRLRNIFIILFLFLAPSFFVGVESSLAQHPASLNHSVFTQILKRYVSKKGLINYRGLKRDKDLQTSLQNYLEDLSQIDPAKLEPVAEQMAYWLNLYNGLMLREILKVYPVQGVSMIPHFFDGPRFGLAAFPKEKLSFLDLEQRVFCEKFSDPRLHLARTNGAINGPPMPGQAFEAGTLDARLDEISLAFLTDTTRNVYDPRRNIFFVSPLFSWFETDFEKWAGSVRFFIQQRIPDLPPKFGLQYSGFDWKLNDAK